MNRAAIYARYSSSSQRAESIEIQLDHCTEFCQENDLQVVATYCDYAQTGRDTDRAEFQHMMRDARSHLFDYVVIYKVTRIMRNKDEMAVARIMLKKAGVEILYAGEDISEGSSGILQLGILEVLAEYESALNSERIKEGIKKNAERGMPNGAELYGWNIVGDHYEINEQEADLIRRATRMINAGATMAEVKAIFAPYRTRKGNEWRYTSIKRLLTRRQNGGEYSYAGTTIENGIPAILPMAEVEQCIKTLGAPNRPHRNTHVDWFALSGRIYCGECHCTMAGASGTGKYKTYYYYRCRKCKKHISRDEIEDTIADAVRQLLQSPDVREKIANLVVQLEDEPEQDRQKEIKAELKEIEVKYGRIWAAIESGSAPPGGDQRIKALQEQQRALESELRHLEALNAVTLTKDHILFLLEDMAKRCDRETILRTFVAQVVIMGEEIRVALTFDDAVPDLFAETLPDCTIFFGDKHRAIPVFRGIVIIV